MNPNTQKLVEQWAPMLDGLGTDTDVIVAANLMDNLSKQLDQSFSQDSKLLENMRRLHIPITRRLMGKLFDNKYLIQLSSNNSQTNHIDMNSIKEIIKNDLLKEEFSLEIAENMIEELFTNFLYSQIISKSRWIRNQSLQELLPGYRILPVKNSLYTVIDKDVIVI